MLGITEKLSEAVHEVIAGMDEVIHALIMALRAEGQIKTLMKPVIPNLMLP